MVLPDYYDVVRIFSDRVYFVHMSSLALRSFWVAAKFLLSQALFSIMT